MKKSQMKVPKRLVLTRETLGRVGGASDPPEITDICQRTDTWYTEQCPLPVTSRL